jgi:hypothetical protein
MAIFSRCRFVSLLLCTVTIVALLPFAPHALSKPGDTTHVRVFDNYLWTYYGTQDRRALFPDSSRRYEKILMHFKLKCPTGGCGQWDYTMQVFVRQHTGRIDSSIQKAPSFRVNGEIRDSIPVRRDTTWTTKYNSSKKRTDSTANTPLKITLFADAKDVWKQTDSIYYWPAGYWNYRFDSTGKKVDSLYVKPDSILRVTTKDVYVPFEVVIPYEIARFITPYGQWFAKDREFDWVYDVTDYASLLRDSVEIRTLYSGYSQGSLFTLDFDLIEGIAPKDVYKIENIYTGSFAYGNPNDPIENHLPATTIKVDSASTVTTLKITTTGHGGGGTDNAAEFSDKTHSIKVNGVQRWRQHLWRDDCGQNPVFPQAGTWYFQRGGWCPGDEVYPYYYDLTSLIPRGTSGTIDYDMEPYTNLDLSHGASYTIEAQVMYATGPNFRNNVALEEIRKPNSDFKYRRMNPICAHAQPEIVLRNHGGDTLKSATIAYGVEGQAQQTYEWKGSIAFMDTVHVELPGIDLGAGANRFTVSVSNPNGMPDEYQRDNSMTSSYIQPKQASGTVVLTLRTDKFQNLTETTNGISYEVRDLDGNVVYSRGGFNDLTTYRDTFKLTDGCYQFIISDNWAGDGLIPIQGTSGSYSLKDDKGIVLINATASGPGYLASFGDREVTTFNVSTVTGVNDRQQEESFNLYPNPTSGRFTLELGNLAAGSTAKVRVYSVEGRELFSRTVNGRGTSTLSFDLSHEPAGTYIVRVESTGSTWMQKVVVERK